MHVDAGAGGSVEAIGKDAPPMRTLQRRLAKLLADRAIGKQGRGRPRCISGTGRRRELLTDGLQVRALPPEPYDFEGERGRVESEERQAVELARSFKPEDLGDGPGRQWYASRYNVSYALSKVFDLGLFAEPL